MATENKKPAGLREVDSFLKQLALDFLLDGNDRRVEPRHTITVECTLTPVDRSGQVISDAPATAITRDISTGGIGLTSRDPLHGLMRIELTSLSGTELCACAEVIRCEPSGYYFNVGCRFVDVG